jgi:hypothetical protein
MPPTSLPGRLNYPVELSSTLLSALLCDCSSFLLTQFRFPVCQAQLPNLAAKIFLSQTAFNSLSALTGCTHSGSTSTEIDRFNSVTDT